MNTPSIKHQNVVNPWCDYKHTGQCSISEVRMMPSLSYGFFLLCKRHYNGEVRYMAARDFKRPPWKDAPIYKASIAHGWCDPMAAFAALGKKVKIVTRRGEVNQVNQGKDTQC